LTSGSSCSGPDLPERHQTLRATIDWSYDLLTGEEQGV
jgi:predicted ATPase